jgi:hypothetical protein
MAEYVLLVPPTGHVAPPLPDGPMPTWIDPAGPRCHLVPKSLIMGASRVDPDRR